MSRKVLSTRSRLVEKADITCLLKELSANGWEIHNVSASEKIDLFKRLKQKKRKGKSISGRTLTDPRLWRRDKLACARSVCLGHRE